MELWVSRVRAVLVGAAVGLALGALVLGGLVVLAFAWRFDGFRDGVGVAAAVVVSVAFFLALGWALFRFVFPLERPG